MHRDDIDMQLHLPQDPHRSLRKAVRDPLCANSLYGHARRVRIEVIMLECVLIPMVNQRPIHAAIMQSEPCRPVTAKPGSSPLAI